MKSRTADPEFSQPQGLSTELSWYAEDREKQFRRGCKTQPESWPWRRTAVTYRFNRNGYRAEEFDHTDWSSSWIITGDESVLGVGVDADSTVSAELSRLLACPVINLGVNLGSMFTAEIDIAAVLKRGRPQGVITCWPNWRRFASWNHTQIQHCSEKSLTTRPYDRAAIRFYQAWNHTALHAEWYARLIQNSVWALCSSAGVAQYQCSFVKETADLLGVDSLSAVKDCSRDGEHRGPVTHQHTAELIAEQLAVRKLL